MEVGKIDKTMLGKYKENIVTEKVILTSERLKHIQEHHPGDYEDYGSYIPEILRTPDYIVDDAKNIDTIIFLKTINECGKNVQIVIKLNTNLNEKDKKNSILTFWKVKNKTYKQLIRNKEIIYSRLDKNT